MSKNDLKKAKVALEAEIESVLESYVELRGWVPLFQMCSRLAEKRLDAEAGGIMLAAINFLSDKGEVRVSPVEVKTE